MRTALWIIADAEDATQNFFAELLRNDKFAIADAGRGKLRTFLLHSFTKRLINLQQRDRHRSDISLAALLDESGTHLDPADPRHPAHEFNREWAITTMETAMSHLASEYAQSGKADFFSACRPLLNIDAAGNEDYVTIARQLGIKEGALRVATHRLRHRFREITFATIAETLDTPTEANVRAEIGVLMESLT